MFDYKIIHIDEGHVCDTINILKELGKEDWELVCSLGNNLILKKNIDIEESNDENKQVVVCNYDGWCDFKIGKTGKRVRCTKTFKEGSDICQSAEIIELGEISHVE